MKIPTQLTSNAHWLLRVALASVFVFHGVGKFANLEGAAAMLQISFVEALLVALAETGGGLLVLLGGFRNDAFFDLATRIGALLNIPTILGAIAMVHWGRWAFTPSETHPMGGMEFQTVLLLVMIFVAIKGNAGLNGAEHPTITPA